DPRLNRIEQLLFLQRLGQELNRPRFDCSNRHWNVAMAANEYDSKVDTRFGQHTLKFEPASPWQSDVEHDATGRVGALPGQEFLGRPKRFHLKADRTKKVFQAATHRCVVIDDEYDRLLACCHHAACSPLPGSVNWNVAPWDALGVAHSRPPCACRMVWLTASPIPMPRALVVKKASKRRSRDFLSRPTPESRILTSTPIAPSFADVTSNLR